MDHKPAKILLVDNDHGLRKEVEQKLQDNYEVVGVENGLEALYLLRHSNDFDLLMIDMVMPILGGIELLREVRDISSYQSTPVIMLAKNNDRNTRVNALEAGAIGVLSKPIDPFELEFKVRNLSQISQQMRAYRHQTHLDDLTRLPDSLSAAENVLNEYDRCRRSSLSFALVKIKIDRYTESKKAAPIQLRTTERLVASYLQSAFQRPNDRLGYLGKGEFILSSAEHTLNPLRYYLESLRKNLFDLSVPHAMNEPYPYLTISIGAALGHPYRGVHPLTEFMTLADSCLEEAELKRNSVCCKGFN